MLRYLAAFLILALAPLQAEPQTPDAIAREIIAPQIDPAKLATLKGDRPANPRLYRVLAWLETARRAGGDPDKVIDTAQTVAGYAGTIAAKGDKAAILWSRKKLEEFGAFTPNGIEKMKRGGAPDITQGEHKGDSVALDHVLPRAIVPELAARFWNLEAIASKANASKSDKITNRELELARRWNREGLLSADGLKAVEAAAR